MQCIHINSVQVFIREVQVNKWEIVCVTYLLQDDDFNVYTYKAFIWFLVSVTSMCMYYR